MTMRAGCGPNWILIALALAMLGVLWSTGTPPANALPSEAPVDRSSGLAAAASAQRSQAAAPDHPYNTGSTRTRTELPSFRPDDLGYRVRVLDRFDDQPVSGAIVCYLPLDVGSDKTYHLDDAATLAQFGRETTTDRDGYARVPAGRSQPVSVRAGERFAMTTPDDPLEDGVYGVYVSPDFAVQVQVVEHDGRPAADSEVAIVDPLGDRHDIALTDRDGRVEFVHVQDLSGCCFDADRRPRLAVREGPEQASGSTVPIAWSQASGTATLELRRPPLGSLRIVARTAAGIAVPGEAKLRVRARREDGDPTKFDDTLAERAPMEWVFNRVPLGSMIEVAGRVNADPVEVTLRGPRHAGEEVLLQLHHEAEELSVVGRVEAPSVGRWEIHVGVRVETVPVPVRTGAWVESDGTFRVPVCFDAARLGRPDFELTFRGQQIEERVLRLQLPANGSRIDVGTVAVRPAASIPLASARLICDGEPVRDGWASLTALHDGRTFRGTRTADGTIEFTGAQAVPGKLTVTAGSPWHARREVDVAPAGHVVVELERGGLVTAEFRASGGFPQGLLATLRAEDGLETPRNYFDVTMETRQRLRFGPLRPGSYRLHVGVEGDGAPPAAIGPSLAVRPGVQTRLVGSNAIDLSAVLAMCCIEVSPASAEATVVRADGTQLVFPIAGVLCVPVGGECPVVVLYADGYVPEVISDVSRADAVHLTPMRTVRITTTSRWTPPPDLDVQVVVERVVPLSPATLEVLQRAGRTGLVDRLDSELDFEADVAWEQPCIPGELLRISCVVYSPEGVGKRVTVSNVQVVAGAFDSVQTHLLAVESLDRAVCR